MRASVCARECVCLGVCVCVRTGWWMRSQGAGLPLCMPQAKQLLGDYCETCTLAGLERWTSFPSPYLPQPTRGNAQLHKNMLIDAEKATERCNTHSVSLFFWDGLRFKDELLKNASQLAAEMLSTYCCVCEFVYV